MKYLTAFLVSALFTTALGQDTPASEIEKLFMDSDTFKISISATETAWEKASDNSASTKDRVQKSTSYTVQLENNSNIGFHTLRMDYCTYSDVKILGQICNVKIDSFSQQSGIIENFTASKIKLIGPVSYKYLSSRDYLDEAAGIRLRIYLSSPDGREVMREIRFPKSLSEEKYPWKDPAENKIANQNNLQDTSSIQPQTIPTISKQKYRTFKKADGIEFQARLLSFGSSSGTVKLEMSDSSELVMKLPAFAEADQAYIKD